MTKETTRERIEREAAERETQVAEQRRQASPGDYVYDKSQDAFWDVLDGTMHNDAAVNASIPQALWRVEVEEAEAAPEGEDAPKKRGRPRKRKEKLIMPSLDIRRVENDQFVEGATWWPGEAPIIRDRFINDDGFFPAIGRRILNTFRPGPEHAKGTPKATEAAAKPWLDLLAKVYPDPEEQRYFLNYCAHMVQFPSKKCNAAVVLAGEQRIGKDSIMEPVKAAIGIWNTKNIDPDHLFSQYNPWIETLMLMIDEVRPSKDEFHSSSMYNILKPLIAAPPNTLALNNKHMKLRHVVNVMRVFITTNDWLSMYIPPSDERMFIMKSNLPKLWYMAEDAGYFNRYYEWLEAGGNAAVGEYLASRNVRDFNSKGAVPKTDAWREIASSWDEPEDGIMLALEALGSPDVVFGSELLGLQVTDFDRKDEVANLLKSPRKLLHRMQKAGYSSVPPMNNAARWQFKSGEKRIQSRHCFVRTVPLNSESSVFSRIESHAQAIMGKSLTPREKVSPIKAAGNF